jgi:hypothetical protein
MTDDFFRDYLQQRAHAQSAGHFKYLLGHGTFFENGTTGSDLPQVQHFKTEQKTIGTGCYSNSQRFALMYPGVRYYEGYRSAVVDGRPCSVIPPIEHAWVVAEGKVVDLSLPRKDVERTTYFGVEIPVEFLGKWIGKKFVPPGQRVAVVATILPGTPLLGWYVKMGTENDRSNP